MAVRYVPLVLQGSARTWLNGLPAGSINAWLDFKKAFMRNFTGTYNRPAHPRNLALSVQGADEPDHEYIRRWSKLRNNCEGVHVVQAIQFFVDA